MPSSLKFKPVCGITFCVKITYLNPSYLIKDPYFDSPIVAHIIFSCFKKVPKNLMVMKKEKD